MEAGELSIAGLDSAHTSLLEKFGTMSTPLVTMIPESALNHKAVEVSNIIHGTAFSYGFPDARATWKPRYHYSELDGWTSDFKTCL